MRINLGDVTLWFDVSGPSVVPQGDVSTERPTLVAVHGGPGLDHVNLKAELEPLASHVQVLYYDQRGHGRSDRGTPEYWNLQTWADDLRRLCDADSTRLLRLPSARHTTFRDRPDIAFPAVEEFVRRIKSSELTTTARG